MKGSDMSDPYATDRIKVRLSTKIWQLEEENNRLRTALTKIMVGGNHVALLIGADHPPHTASHEEALEHYGAGDKYEAWCCWRTIMEARDVLQRQT